MIGKAINKLLKDSAGLSALVGTKIYPYAIEEGVALPAVLYRLGSTVPQYTKDGVANESSTVEVWSYATTYMSALDISAQVRLAMELKKGTFEGVDVALLRISSIEEGFDFDDNIFFSRINFTIITN